MGTTISTELAADEPAIAATVAAMLSSYPTRSDDRPSKTYVKQLIGACRDATPAMLRAMLDPRTGIPGRHPYLPTCADLRAFIAEQRAEAARMSARVATPLIEKEFKLSAEERAARIAKLRAVRGKLVQHSDADRAERMANMFSRHRA
jgi:hypothetical protein